MRTFICFYCIFVIFLMSARVNAVEFGTFYTSSLFTDQLYSVDISTGLLREAGATEFAGVSGLTFDPSTRNLYGIAQWTDQLITIDTATGMGTAVDVLSLGSSVSISGLAFSPITNILYGIDGGFDRLVTIEPATGTTTAIGLTGFNNITSIAFDSSANKLYGVDKFTQRLVDINLATGAGTAVDNAPVQRLGFANVTGLEYDPVNDRLLGIASASRYLITIDRTTGVGERLVDFLFFGSNGLNDPSIRAFVFAPSVPEPNTSILLAFAACLTATRRRGWHQQSLGTDIATE